MELEVCCVNTIQTLGFTWSSSSGVKSDTIVSIANQTLSL